MSQSLQQKAALMARLAAMDSAGINPEQAIGTLRKDASPAYRKKLQAMQRQLRNGKGVAEAGEQAGVLETLDAARVRIAENSGDRATTFKALADEYGKRHARLSRIRTRLMMPVLVLLIAAFVKPFPALVRGDMNLTAYLGASMGMLMVVAFLVYMLLRVRKRLDTAEGREGVLGAVTDRLALTLPVFKTLTRRREQNRFLGNLSHLLEAGLAMQQAIPIALTAVRNRHIREDFAAIQPDLEFGDTFTQAFSRCIYAQRDAVQHLSVAETAGTLPSTLRHFCEIEQEMIDQADDTVSQWIPRLIFALIVIWVLTG